MQKGVCRVGDQITGVCNASVHNGSRNFVGTWTTGSSVVSSEGLGVVRVGDLGITDCGHTIRAIQGSSIVTADGIGVVRVGDQVEVIEGGYGTTTTGSGLITSE